MRNKWLLLCLFVSFSAHASGSFVVGNGGQGVEVNGALILRDLFEAGINDQPVMGHDIDAQLMREVQASPLISLGIDAKLLATKLTDLNARRPNFGSDLALVIALYKWIDVETDLAPVPDAGACDQGVLFSGNPNFVQLANRHLDEIRVHGPSWRKLSPEQRVALVIHEVVYSLIVKAPPKDCAAESQSSDLARTLVGALFGAERPLSKWQVAQLNLPELSIRPANAQATITLFYLVYRNPETCPASPEAADFAKCVHDFCQVWPMGRIEIEYQPVGDVAHFREYASPRGPQLLVELSVAQADETVVDSPSSEACPALVAEAARNFIR